MLTNQRNTYRLVILIATICLGPIGALAQLATGSIQGLVSDKSGAIVPNATVTVTNTATGLARNADSNASGLYDFPSLPPGDYTVTAEATGFSKQVFEHVVLTVNAEQSINFDLSPGGATETMTVTSTAPVVDAVSSTVAPVVGAKTIVDMRSEEH